MKDQEQKGWVEYYRRSQDREDKQVASIPSQKAATSKIKEEYKLNIIAPPFEDEMSAKYPGRPKFDAMMRLIEEGKVQGIITWDINRLSRNAYDSGRLQWLMDSIGLEIRTPTQHYTEDNSSTAFKNDSGRSEQFSKDLSKVVKRSNETHFTNGRCLGPAPQGYLNVRDRLTNESYVIKDEERFSKVQKLWDMLLSEQYSPAEICRYANNELKFTVRATRSMPAHEIRLSSLLKIFRNPFYYGLMVREVNGKKMKKLGNHPPMITKQEFLKAQQILSKLPRCKPPMDASTGLNAASIKCGECGYAITFETHKKTYKSGKTSYFSYARCTKKGHKCNQKYVPLDKLNEQIEEVLEKLAIDDEFVLWAIDYLKSENKNEEQERESMRGEYQKRLDDIRHKINRLLEVYLDDPEIMTKDDYFKRKQQLEEQEELLRDQLEAVHYRTKDWLELVEKRLDFAKDSLYEYRNGDSRMRRHIVKTIGGSNLTLKDGTLIFIPVNEFKTIYEHSELLKVGSP